MREEYSCEFQTCSRRNRTIEDLDCTYALSEYMREQTGGACIATRALLYDFQAFRE